MCKHGANNGGIAAKKAIRPVRLRNIIWAMNSSTMNTTGLVSIQRLREAEHLNAIAEDIRISYIWVVFSLGFPGNFFSIITVLTMRTLTPATWYVAFLALCDGLTLVTKLVGHQMATHGLYFGTAGCKAFFVTGFLSALSNWTLVLICAERCVSVCFPLKKEYICTKRRAYLSSLVLTLTLLGVFSIMHGVMRDKSDDGLYCGTLDEYLNFWTTGWYWISSCIHLFIPLPIIVVLTIVIIRGLRKSRRVRRNIMHNGDGCESNNANTRLLKETERLERNISVMLILVAVLFLVLSLPACIHILAYEKSSDVLVEARWRLFDQIQFVCIDSSHAVNFFLYFLSAKKFREQFIYLVTCHKWPKYFKKIKSNRTNHSTVFATKYAIARSSEDLSRIKLSNTDLHTTC